MCTITTTHPLLASTRNDSVTPITEEGQCYLFMASWWMLSGSITMFGWQEKEEIV